MKKVISTSAAPAPIGPYNQAIEFNNQIFVSGQIAIDPENGSFIQDNIEAETTRVMKNLEAVLSAAGYNMNDIVKCSIFVKDLNLFSRVNSVYGTFFQEGQEPARETVEVSELPKGANVEISCIAIH